MRSFLAAAASLLAADEARHNLHYGISATLEATPEAYPGARLWTVEAGNDAVAALLMTPPWNVVVAKPTDDAALELAAVELARDAVPIPGVTGAVPEVHVFAGAWERETGAARRLRMGQGIYAAHSTRLLEGVAGEMRFATADDRDLVVEWIVAFQDEVIPADARHQGIEAIVDRRIGSDSGGYALWDDGRETVSLSGWGGRTPHGTRIGPVYTPPELRRRGYAGALVGRLTQHLLDGGLDYCFLYTDLSNPTSNHVYVNVGYERVCDSVDYAFD